MAADPAAESFEARFRAFYEGCNDEEQRFLELVVARASADLGDDVAGFASQPVRGMAGDRVDRLPPLEMFGAISNIMKTKHDTVKNSISNVR